MKKRILSFLMVFCMAVALLPTTALATTAIVYTVNLTMSKVEVGKPLPTDAKTPATANTEVTSIEWKGDLDANGNAIAGKKYTATIMVELKKDKDAKLGDSIKAKVNNSSTGVSTIRFGIRVRVTYTCTAGQTEKPAATPNIMSLKITMTAPKVGESLPTTAKTSSSSNYKVTKVEWSGQLDENGNMAYETEYTAVFTVEIKEGKNVKFTTAAPEHIAKNSTLNGDYVIKSAERVSDTLVRLTYVLPAVKKPSTTISKLDNINLDIPSVGYAPDKSGYTNNSAKIKVTETKWSGEVDNYGLAIAGAVYSYTFTVEIKPEYELTFATGALKGSVAGRSDGVRVERVSDKKAVVTYTFPPLEEKVDKDAEKELGRRWSLAEADANYPLSDPITLVVSEDTVDMGAVEEMLDFYYKGSLGGNVYSGLVQASDYHTLDGRVIRPKDYPKISANYSARFPLYQVTGVVYDLWFPSDYSVAKFPNVKEIWLSPKCDIQGILNKIAREVYDEGSDRGSFYTYDHVLFIPESAYPNGPTYNTDAKGIPGCRVMLYSGDDVYAAAKKGASAARDWCTSHTYTAELFTPDRLYKYGNCQNHTLFYYSCSKCGKCEYNPKHVFVYTPLYLENIGIKLTINDGRYGAHQYEAYTVSDEHFLGLNAQGDRVYLKACASCGKDQKQTDLATTYDYYKNGMGMDGDRSYYQLYMESVKKSWSPGGTAYEMRMKATPGKDYLDGFVVVADKFVTAKTSGWAKQSVQVASNDNLIDKALLGNDYTGTINRLQFASVAVKMTEEMLGRSITPAPSGTFTDTDSEYVRKAYAAGITSGSGGGAFDPDGILTRQQMAAFLYRALMYVKANSDTEYTVYESKLGSYTDAGQLQSWAKDAMDFMSGLGLISGTSDTTLSPNKPCTIEQALIVADRSLDAGGIGWYQLIKLPSDNGFVDFAYGDRIWLTSSKGTFINRYGRESSVGRLDHYYAIKDR